MLVHDVVQIVNPGALTSTPAGRWLVAHRDDVNDAIRLADRFNECRSFGTIGGISYIVEIHDEESPDRAPLLSDSQRARS